jgi:CO/xanthine dehydrogenase Mo-binding subunit
VTGNAEVTTTGIRGVVGDRLPRVDGSEKVSGEFLYASDLHVAGMLHGRTLRSPYAHARIVELDIAPALAMSGVRAALTYDDVPGGRWHGMEIQDQPVLATDRVRYFGEPIAVVAAEDPETARRALEAIRVEYESLPAIVDVEAALHSPPIHDDPPRLDKWRSDERPNVVRSIVITHGDPDATGDVSVAGYYELGMQDQAFLGPEAGLAVPDGEGGIDLYVATQDVHHDQEQVAKCLGLPAPKVRVHLSGVGGAFGAREDLSVQVHAAMLALETGRAVRMVYDREESFVGHPHRHPARIWYEHRARADGTLVAIRARALFDGGAYASCSGAVTSVAASFACGPYRVPNALIDVASVYTNNPPCGAMRGFGATQMCFGYEAQMDRLAAALGMDPVEIRLRNALRRGDVLPFGQSLTTSLPVRETIEACARLEIPAPEALPREAIRLPGGAGNTTHGEGVRRGVGFALGFKNVHYSEGSDDTTAARVRLFAGVDGTVAAEVFSGAVEFGQGIVNVITQVVRTELGIDQVILSPPSTADRLTAGTTAAARTTWMTGGAVKECCDAIREELARRGGLLEPGEEIEIERIYRHPRTTPMDRETGQALGERLHVAFVCAAMRAVVEVDVELGLVRVVWLGVAQDAGRAINPIGVEGQIEGGAAQGLGLALMEEIQTEGGVIRNASFTDYLLPTMLDMPPVDMALVESPEAEAPYGLKGVSEGSMVVTTAAIAAAVRDATGLGLNRVPIRPEAIVEATPIPGPSVASQAPFPSLRGF